jgi:vacuolar-type H+-ATPase subunit C/Vma6
VIEAREPAMRRKRLAEAFTGSALAPVFADAEHDLAGLERRALAARIAAERRLARREPLGAAPILEYALRLRAELGDLRHLHWGLAQGAAPERLLAELLGGAR